MAMTMNILVDFMSLAMTEMVMRGERGCPPPDVISDDALLSPAAYDFDSFSLRFCRPPSSPTTSYPIGWVCDFLSVIVAVEFVVDQQDRVRRRQFFFFFSLCISNVDRNLFTYANLIDVIEEMGCPRNSIIYHKLPNADLDGGLVGLTGDIDLLDMFATHEGFNVPIEVYVDSPGMYNGSEDDEEEFNVPRESDPDTEHEGDEGDSESDTSGLVMSSEENEEYDVPIEKE
ncbi:hypothetical protein RHGRI_011275 [Rhododendron griersonianum]|uniref:PB1 domain-containing protein n=1 Tax=Rhododendron griersonianum TaxID=479676 RepID=A0AAV6KMD1_9ERIC|nr:hypothetical protein RHGRI_011275 [Rhododendron griersonianum]